MRYLALACDYDGTLATDGRVDEATIACLERVRASGRKLILVTGRELDDLASVFDRLELFDWVVAENGAVTLRPMNREVRDLAERPPAAFIHALQARGVAPLSVGRVIVAGWQPHADIILKTIQEMGLGLQVIFNKSAVMVLPEGITKATGLSAVLRDLGLSPHNVVGVGDAENDHAFLSFCECAVAVANALPAVQRHADRVTKGDHGAGVRELIQELLRNDLADWGYRLPRHALLLGTGADGQPVKLPSYGTNVLIAGPSGSGKSTVTAALLERLAEHKYQFCIVDPEGDYENLKDAVTLGTTEHGPAVGEVLQLLKNPEDNAVVNLVGLPLADRPGFFTRLFPRLQELRFKTGHPHWIVIDEAHHLLPASWEPGKLTVPQLDGLLLVTVHPQHLTPAILQTMHTIIAVGKDPQATLQQFCETRGQGACPSMAVPEPESAGVMLWSLRNGTPPAPVRIIPGRTERRRHTRKYAEGELPPERSFYFRGPGEKLNLRAQNLMLFLQLAEGVDDATWQHHLRQGDYSRWFRDKIKDESLAAEAARVEARSDLSARESRDLIRTAVERSYTLPESPSMPMPGTDAGKK
jgi:HAD superfamily hydrolase (TIGR01484 family)